MEKNAYTKDFILNNIKTTLFDNYICTVNLMNYEEYARGGDHIDLDFSANSLIFHSININDNTLIKKIEKFINYVPNSRSCYPITDCDKVNDLFNCILEHFGKLEIGHIYVENEVLWQNSTLPN